MIICIASVIIILSHYAWFSVIGQHWRHVIAENRVLAQAHRADDSRLPNGTSKLQWWPYSRARACGIFEHTEDVFKRLVAAGLKPWTADGLTMKTGTGVLGGAATAYWGTNQAAFSLAAVAGNLAVRLLPGTHNFPLHCLVWSAPLEADRVTRRF
jgi:hypothetical protein